MSDMMNGIRNMRVESGVVGIRWSGEMDVV